MNRRDQYEIRLCEISYSIKKTLYKCLPEESVRNASNLLKQCSTLAKQSGESNISMYSKLLKLTKSKETTTRSDLQVYPYLLQTRYQAKSKNKLVNHSCRLV